VRLAYFDCFAGASGDMILGALLHAGLELETLRTELAKLDLSGYEIRARKCVRKGIAGTKFDVIIEGHADQPHAVHNRGHVHKPSEPHHAHRTLKDIRRLIDRSGLSDGVKKTAIRIFMRLAEAESKIHDRAVDDIHFHEVGAVDSIIDIVGAAIGFELLGIGRIAASRIHVGCGTVQCAHGTLPVPAPATAELLKGIPVFSSGIEGELTTPTGAAILTTLAESFGPMPPLRIGNIGYGAGFHDLPIANMLRVSIGETDVESESDAVRLIETNIDDMNPQFYEHLMDKLFEAGAKDVFLNQIIMKKSRPGVILSIIADPAGTEELIDLVFRETTTLGVRISDVKKRMILKQEVRTVRTPWGEARVKVRVLTDGSRTYEPEYEDCKALANTGNITIQKVYEELKTRARKEEES